MVKTHKTLFTDCIRTPPMFDFIQPGTSLMNTEGMVWWRQISTLYYFMWDIQTQVSKMSIIKNLQTSLPDDKTTSFKEKKTFWTPQNRNVPWWRRRKKKVNRKILNTGNKTKCYIQWKCNGFVSALWKAETNTTNCFSRLLLPMYTVKFDPFQKLRTMFLTNMMNKYLSTEHFSIPLKTADNVPNMMNKYLSMKHFSKTTVSTEKVL